LRIREAFGTPFKISHTVLAFGHLDKGIHQIDLRLNEADVVRLNLSPKFVGTAR
jgi:hypothetical protein